ncbi:MAG: BON domain-containing protein [Rhizobium sp.]
MLFLAKLSSLTTSSNSCATCAAIRCLIAYADGLADCRIDAAVAEGAILLTGTAPNDQARQRAIEIAGEYAGTRIISNIVIQADVELPTQPENGPSSSTAPTVALKPPKETS